MKVHKENIKQLDWMDKPMFQTKELNSSIIVKHRLRRDETDRFNIVPPVATKIIIPIDRRELKSGGRYIFVDQINYEETMAEIFGLEKYHTDMLVLDMMNKLPSLDPFLLKERLARAGIEPANCYFSLSASDLDDMLEFVKVEITPLVYLSVEGATTSMKSVERMAVKILSNLPSDRTDSLGKTLGLSPEQYDEGVFCWKGFLYYKWSLAKILKDLGRVSEIIYNVKATGPVDVMARDYIARAQRTIKQEIISTTVDVRCTLQIYDNAYEALTENGNPLAFKNFLIEAPTLFAQLGEQIGAIQHIISFSDYQFGSRSFSITGDELMEILMDFQMSLRPHNETN